MAVWNLKECRKQSGVPDHVGCFIRGYCVSCLQYHGSKYEMGEKMECSMRTWTERMLLKGGYNSKADALIVGQNIKVLLKLWKVMEA